MSMGMQDMVKSLAALPDDKREVMMRERLNMFAKMPDEERHQGMLGMIKAVVSLPEGERKKLVRTRTQTLMSLPDETRQELMMTHMAALQSLSEQERMAEMQAVQSVVMELPEPQRGMMQGMMEKMMGGMPMGGMAPDHARARPAGQPRPAPAGRSVATAGAGTGVLAGWGRTLLWLTALSGLWLLIAPFVLGFSASGAATGNHVLFGIAIAVLAGLVAAAGSREGWGSALTWLVTLSGAWLVISPFVTGYGGSAQGNAVLFGAAVTILAGIVAVTRPEE